MPNKTHYRADSMSGGQFFRPTIAVCLLALCTSCAEIEEATKTAAEAVRNGSAAFQPRTAYWNPHGASGRTKIVAHLAAQRAYFYKGKTVIGESTISTGRRGFETPPGRYTVIQKDAHHVSTIYGDFVGTDGRVVKPNVDAQKERAPRGTHFVGAKMPYFLRFTGGYGMHAGYVPRYRASHACIRMPTQMAKHFFDAAELGTPVIEKGN